jgi:phosphoserine aminotransferase
MSTSRTATDARPEIRPRNTCFMSGPCAKRPGYSLTRLDTRLLGRSRRGEEPTLRRREVIERSRALLGMPADWRLAIVPGSDMGALEIALWSLLGPRPVDALDCDRFSHFWAQDVVEQLKIPHSRVFHAPYGRLPDLSQIDWSHDLVFVWNATTSGVCVPDDGWIPLEREGLVICDATSAAFAMPLPWDRLDVVTWSWQKALGGEGAHGMLALSPRAVERLTTYTPPWPVPRLFRLIDDGKLMEGVFRGDSINTPSHLCVEDVLDSLRWAESMGGLPTLIDRTNANYEVVADWVERTSWVDFLVQDLRVRSRSSPTLLIVSPWYRALDPSSQTRAARRLTSLLQEEKVAYDMDANPSAPPGLRIWCGPTIEKTDLEALLPWLDWAYTVVADEYRD